MKRLYSQSTGCTYIPGVHSEMPSDAVEISQQRFEEVIAAPSFGKTRAHDEHGLPILVDQAESGPPTEGQVEAARLLAYADPLHGSDRYFAEALRMQSMGEAGWEAIIEAGKARYADIQVEHPWPASGSR